MANKKTTLTQDVKTMFIGECKELVGWLQSFGKPKLPLDGMMIKEKSVLQQDTDFAWFQKLDKPKRARTKKGTYRADDKSTKDVNEAWVGGKAPKRDKGIGYKK